MLRVTFEMADGTVGWFFPTAREVLENVAFLQVFADLERGARRGQIFHLRANDEIKEIDLADVVGLRMEWNI